MHSNDDCIFREKFCIACRYNQLTMSSTIELFDVQINTLNERTIVRLFANVRSTLKAIFVEVWTIVIFSASDIDVWNCFHRILNDLSIFCEWEIEIESEFRRLLNDFIFFCECEICVECSVRRIVHDFECALKKSIRWWNS
jgi:hypothetical protein